MTPTILSGTRRCDVYRAPTEEQWRLEASPSCNSHPSLVWLISGGEAWKASTELVPCTGSEAIESRKSFLQSQSNQDFIS